MQNSQSPPQVVLGDAFSNFETLEDREKRKKEAEVRAYENANPFRKLGIQGEWAVSGLYHNLHPSGLGALVCLWWYQYPTWCRYRHANVQRYTKPQVMLRRRWFSTNIPKIENPHERRGIIIVFWGCVFLRTLSSLMYIPFDAPEEAYLAIK